MDPVDILKIFQKYIVTGRKLDLVSDSETIEGLTNLKMVDRHNILKKKLILDHVWKCSFMESLP